MFSGIILLCDISLWIWQHTKEAEYSVIKVCVKDMTMDMTTYGVVIVVTLYF